MKSLRWTSRDLEVLPENGKRYEIVDGDLYMSKQPHLLHQFVCGQIYELLQAWSRQTKAGRAFFNPGVIFTEDDDVVPDVIWISRERLAAVLQPDGHLHAAPELAIEALSPGTTNERRDREAKLKLYSRQGVLEYWIVDWQKRSLEVYRREDATLTRTKTFYEGDVLQSPLFPGLVCQISQLFDDSF